MKIGTRRIFRLSEETDDFQFKDEASVKFYGNIFSSKVIKEAILYYVKQ